MTAFAPAEVILHAMRRWHPHLVLLDMGLAGADALEVLRRVRGVEPTIGVVMLTGNRELALARLGFELGATDCLFKPFDLDRLGQAVTSSIGRPSLHSSRGRPPRRSRAAFTRRRYRRPSGSAE